MAEIKTVLKGSPERIHLIIEDSNGEQPFGSFSEACKMARQGDGLMWCEDSQGPSDISYVRADIVDDLIEAAVLSANAGKVDAWQPIESAPQGTLSLFVDMGAYEVRNLYFVDWMVGGLFCGIRTRNATHWMPLPAAPTQQASDAGKV